MKNTTFFHTLISVCRHATEIQGFAFTPNLVQDMGLKKSKNSLSQMPETSFLTLKNSFTILSDIARIYHY